jgi:hypothetical protein
MIRRLGAAAVLLSLAAGLLAPPPATAQDENHRMETDARYVVDPDAGAVDVTVGIEFTNTAPDPPGQFSVFEVIDVAIHDAAEEVTARDDDGALEVATADRDGVHVATISLREPLRFEESATLELSFRLPDRGEGGLRIGPSLVVFPAWSFGTAGEVTVELPVAYEVRVDGDPLEAEPGEGTVALTSGPVEDPTRWLALVTAYRLGAYTTLERSIPLSSGTVDLRVRSFEEDPAWGERIRDLLVTALPLLEDAIGLPYERAGPLVVVESPPAGFGSIDEQIAEGGEILVAFDAADFTVLHQVSHVWIGHSLFGERWIREGLASHYAAVVAPGLDLEPLFGPGERADELSEAAFALEDWQEGEPGSDPQRDAYAYAASWRAFEQVSETIGPDALRAALLRIHAGIDAYDARAVDGTQPTPAAPPAPVDSRRLLDQLEVGGESVDHVFAELVFSEDAVEQLDDRSAARAELADLAQQAGEWGIPQNVQQLMRDWDFDGAREAIDRARAWLVERDGLLAEVSAAGLAAPSRLREAYQRHGGEAEAHTELAALRAVVADYRAALDEVAEERSLIARLGLVGAVAPGFLLESANRLFTEGQLHEATEAIVEARELMATAEVTGLLRLLATLAVVLVLMAGLAVFLRRRSPTAKPGD